MKKGSRKMIALRPWGFFLTFVLALFPNNEFHEVFYDKTEKSMKSSHLNESNIFQGFQGGVPFAFPKNGLEESDFTVSALRKEGR